jgi:hypothetical protein
MEAFRNFLLLKKCSNLKVLLHKNDIVPSQPNSKQTHQIRRLKFWTMTHRLLASEKMAEPPSLNVLSGKGNFNNND